MQALPIGVGASIINLIVVVSSKETLNLYPNWVQALPIGVGASIINLIVEVSSKETLNLYPNRVQALPARQSCAVEDRASTPQKSAN